MICQTETKKLIWLLGIAILVIMLIQYFEIPYIGVLSSIVSASNVAFFGRSDSPVGNVSSNCEILDNTALWEGTNTSVPAAPALLKADDFSYATLAKNVSNKTDTSSPNIQNGSAYSVYESSFGIPQTTSSTGIAQLAEGVSLGSDVNGTSLSEGMNIASAAAPEKAASFGFGFFPEKVTDENDSLLANVQNGRADSVHGSLFSIPPIVSSANIAPVANMDTDSKTAVFPHYLNESSLHNTERDIITGNKNPKSPKFPVMSIYKMREVLLPSHSSYHPSPPKWSSTIDQELQYAKSRIENPPAERNLSGLYRPIYWNISVFERSYALMNNMLKVYIYKEGEQPIFHHSILNGIYASEGWFLKLLEANKQFVTEDPAQAHLFYLPFSSRLLQLTLYKRNSHSRSNLIEYMKNYVDMLRTKYAFWNRTGGADHFLAACHDWAPAETRGLMLNCIRALCNADLKAGFDIGKDISLPTTYVRSPQDPQKDLGGLAASQRRILAFFAGHMHGYVRPKLLQYWANDTDMRIMSRMPQVKGNKNYINHMKSSKYCICARGFAVHSPRIVESIFYECVPVIIADNYVPPLFGALRWEAFAVFVLEKDIPNLKNILLSISEEEYFEMHKRLKKVQQHFIWHDKPVKYDLFHMILHSIWFNRVSRFVPL